MKNFNRLRFLRIAVSVGLLVGIFFSFELWFPINRTFPRVPVFFEVPELIDQTLTVILIVSLLSIIFFQKYRLFSLTTITSLVFLAIFDQLRWQPWVFQYFLILSVLSTGRFEKDNSSTTLGLIQILIAALYIWSGLQKLNYTFVHETLPILLSPLENFISVSKLPIVFIGLTSAVIEKLVGCGLLFRKTRRLAVCSAIILHTVVLTLLIAKNYNQIVWFWNATLIALVFFSFWRSDNPVFENLRQKTFGLEKLIKFIVVASCVLPILSFFGLWDMYLSGALYAGGTEIGVIRINENLYENLPPKAKQSVFEIAKDREKILPLFEWSMTELNVPVYPEERVFKSITRKICLSAQDKNEIELIIKTHPSMIDGSYDLLRINCHQMLTDEK